MGKKEPKKIKCFVQFSTVSLVVFEDSMSIGKNAALQAQQSVKHLQVSLTFSV